MTPMCLANGLGVENIVSIFVLSQPLLFRLASAGSCVTVPRQPRSNPPGQILPHPSQPGKILVPNNQSREGVEIVDEMQAKLHQRTVLPIVSNQVQKKSHTSRRRECKFVLLRN